jgi:hypothetical protein
VVDGQTGCHLPAENVAVLRSLRVGPGAELNIRVVYIHGKASKMALDVMKSPPFRAGIQLTAAVNPVVGLATHYLESLTKLLIQQGHNRTIVNARFGMHPYGGPISSGIGVGDYLFVQPPTDFDFGELRWDSQQERVIHNTKPLDTNYLLLRVAAHQIPGAGPGRAVV